MNIAKTDMLKHKNYAFDESKCKKNYKNIYFYLINNYIEILDFYFIICIYIKWYNMSNSEYFKK